MVVSCLVMLTIVGVISAKATDGCALSSDVSKICLC